jgi:hypothetical protein
MGRIVELSQIRAKIALPEEKNKRLSEAFCLLLIPYYVKRLAIVKTGGMRREY